jgi:hypothetical protein
MDDDVLGPASRRGLFGLMGGAGLAAGAAFTPDAADAAGASSGPLAERMFEVEGGLPMFRAVERIERTLEEREVVWWYHFTWFGLRPDQKPRRLIRFEGIEMTRIKRLGANRYETHGHNVSYARSDDGKDWLTRWTNPYTGAVVTPADNVIENDPGHERSVEGVRSLAPGGVFKPYDVTFRVEGDRLKLERVRIPPPTWPGQFIETSTTSVLLRDFDRAGLATLPAEGSGMWVQPPPKWLDMGHPEGVLVGYFNGRKCPWPENLPAAFRQRLEARHPHLAHVADAKFRLT